MIPGSKGLNPHELAHVGKRPWDPPRYEHKSGITIPRYANIGTDCESAEHETIRRYHNKYIITGSNDEAGRDTRECAEGAEELSGKWTGF